MAALSCRTAGTVQRCRCSSLCLDTVQWRAAVQQELLYVKEQRLALVQSQCNLQRGRGTAHAPAELQLTVMQCRMAACSCGRASPMPRASCCSPAYCAAACCPSPASLSLIAWAACRQLGATAKQVVTVRRCSHCMRSRSAEQDAAQPSATSSAGQPCKAASSGGQHVTPSVPPPPCRC